MFVVNGIKRVNNQGNIENFGILCTKSPKISKKNSIIFFYSELRHEISNNVVCATSKASDQPVHVCLPVNLSGHVFLYYVYELILTKLV